MQNELVEAKPFILMDKADEEQILKEMRGDIIKEFVYSYRDKKGKIVEGLSNAGVNATSMEMAVRKKPLRVLEQWITEDDKYYKAIVKVGRYIVNDDGTEILVDTTLGSKRQAKFFKPGVENQFAFEQAVVKAERNGKRRLMPEKIIIEMLKLYKNQGKVKKIEAPVDSEKEEPDTPEVRGGATQKQLDLLKKMKVEYDKNITIREASELITKKIAEDKESKTEPSKEPQWKASDAIKNKPMTFKPDKEPISDYKIREFHRLAKEFESDEWREILDGFSIAVPEEIKSDAEAGVILNQIRDKIKAKKELGKKNE